MNFKSHSPEHASCASPPGVRNLIAPVRYWGNSPISSVSREALNKSISCSPPFYRRYGVMLRTLWHPQRDKVLSFFPRWLVAYTEGTAAYPWCTRVDRLGKFYF